MWKNFGLVVFAGLSAGSLVGVVEAIRLLLAVGAGEYDALLWGGVGYGLLGGGLSVVFFPLSWRWVALQVFVRVFMTVATLLVWWVFEPLTIAIVGVLMLYWLMGVVIDRTPLRILLTPKGALGVTTLWFVLLVTFSLTPSQRIYSPPVHQNSAVGKPNVLLITVDGLSEKWLQSGYTPKLTSLEKSAWRFTNAFTNAPNRFGGVSALMTSTYRTSSSPLMESIQTLGERLAYEGYQTHAMVSHLAVGRFANLHQGFDQFRYIPPKMPSDVLRWGLGNEGAQHLKLAHAILHRFPPSRRSVNEVVRLFQNDLRTHHEVPWFGWLHLLPSQTVTKEGLRTLDRSIGDLIRSVSDGTIVVLTASFQYSTGETFNRLPVPLMVWVPKSSPRVIHNNVLLSDVATTLTSLVGVSSGEDWEGRNVLRLPPMYDQHIIEVTQPDWVWRQQGNWRWILHQSQEALYDVSIDPDMKNNVLGQHPEVLQRLRQH